MVNFGFADLAMTETRTMEGVRVKHPMPMVPIPSRTVPIRINISVVRVGTPIIRIIRIWAGESETNADSDAGVGCWSGC